MNHDAERQSMVRYTIMPDYGGAYGWINRNGPEDALGPNHADTCGWSGDQRGGPARGKTPWYLCTDALRT